MICKHAHVKKIVVTVLSTCNYEIESSEVKDVTVCVCVRCVNVCKSVFFVRESCVYSSGIAFYFLAKWCESKKPTG